MADGLSGNLIQLPLPSVLTMLAAGHQTGRLELLGDQGDGELHLKDGTPVHAIFGVLTGEPAAIELLAWRAGNFRFMPGVAPQQTTLSRALPELQEAANRQAAEREALRRVIPTDACTFKLLAALPSEPLTLAPHEWLIIASVEPGRTLDDIAFELDAPPFEVLKAMVRLVNLGLLDVKAAAAQQSPAAAIAAATGAAASGAVRGNALKPAFFERLATEVMAALGPIGEFVIDDEIDNAGLSRETFPREMAPQLVEKIGLQIRDAGQRVNFQRSMLAFLKEMK